METEATQREAVRALATVAMDRWCAPAGADLPGLLARNQRALDQPAWLANWLDYLRAGNDLANRGFGRLAEAIDQGRIRCEDALAGFNLAIFDLLAREILANEPALASFSGAQQRSLQQQFRNCDEQLKVLQRQQLAARIAANPVDPGNAGALVANLSGRELLNHVCAHPKAQITLRALMDRAGEALAGLKPCFMMGPMSVAQYLKPGGIGFDLIVMDEASQLRPEDAIGAVARGTQLVVVGDPRQLPPTNFFQTIVDGAGDGDDALVVGTAESILDAALPLFPTRSLCWHYRSRHESLIAFSNHHFYQGRLVVFPSPNANTPDYGVQLTRVPGGRFVEQRNVAEATAVAEAVRAHLCGTASASLGVVAMNAKQREQIERAVESLAKDDALFRDRLETNRGTQEPLFIKNLENVQGDERDLILISCTYGPHTPGGLVPQLFGPINQQTGWRRLNVLFTRAKQRMHLFASMTTDDIVVGANSSRGVKAFHDFLAYAATGVLSQAQPTDRPPDSDFEIAVAAALGQAGFDCVPQVGVAGFFIDLAVRDPGRPGRYLMGIECDGATYHSAKSVRDRDRLRQAILEGLGWQIRRIWSTDWYKNPQAQIKPIIAELNQLKTPAPVVVDAVTPTSTPAVLTAPVDEAGTSGAAAVAPPRRAVPHVPRPTLELSPVELPHQQTLALEEVPTVAAAAPVAVMDLRERLLQFDRQIIRPAAPDTPDDRRLLRPAMIDALVAHRPVDQGEFLELIPSYLRQRIAPAEGHWLADVLRIIESSE